MLSTAALAMLCLFITRNEVKVEETNVALKHRRLTPEARQLPHVPQAELEPMTFYSGEVFTVKDIDNLRG